MKIAIILPSLDIIPKLIQSAINHKICFVNFTLGQKQIDYQLDTFQPNLIITAKKLLIKRDIVLSNQYKIHYIDTVGGMVLYLLPQLLKGYIAMVSGDFIKHFLDQSFYLYTSGSTGNPKLVELRVKKIYENITGFLGHSGLEDNHHFLCVLPGFHSFGLSTNIVFPLLQKTGHLNTRLKFYYFSNIADIPGVIRVIQKYKINYLAATPQIISMIIRFGSTRQLHTIKSVFVGGDFTSSDIITDFADKIPHGKYVKGYGMTECFPVISSNDIQNIQYNTDGRILPHITYKLFTQSGGWVDSGEGILHIHQDYVIDKYLVGGNLPMVLHQDALYFNTNDWVSVDEKRNITLLARDSRIIKKGGELINIQYLEHELQHYFDEQQYCCIAHNNNIYIVTEKSYNLQQINTYIIESGLSPLYKLYKNYVIKGIPRNGIGKILYHDVYLHILEHESLCNN